MADNKDLEVWLAPIESDRVLIPFRVSVRTMIGTTVIEAVRIPGGGRADPLTPVSTSWTRPIRHRRPRT